MSPCINIVFLVCPGIDLLMFVCSVGNGFVIMVFSLPVVIFISSEYSLDLFCGLWFFGRTG
jgi:hypothetical protein